MKQFGVICCSVLKMEVEHIMKQDFPDVEIKFLDSMLHMHPLQLQESVEKELQQLDIPVLVIYGDCGPDMHNIEERYNCVKIPAVNCCDILAGHDVYKKFRKEQVFVFLPEWTQRWQEVFQKELGFSNEDLARSFMQEYRKTLVYLDTGCVPIPKKTIKEIEKYFDMPVEIIPQDNGVLRKNIHQEILRLTGEA